MAEIGSGDRRESVETSAEKEYQWQVTKQAAT